MNIIYVDEDEKAIFEFESAVKGIRGIQTVRSFLNGSDAMEFIRRQQVDIAFLEVELTETDGISLAERLQEIQPNLCIVFVTASSAYALQAFGVNAVGYILKPYHREKLEKQIQKIRTRFQLRDERRVHFQTMPRFEVFIDGQLFPISKRKVKELLALLVDFAGSSITSEQAITYLWEDRLNDETTKALLRMTAKRLRDILIQENIDFILIEENGVRAIDTRKVTCDYYDMMKGEPEAVERYQGEYMVEYSWAEMTNAKLNQIAEKRRQPNRMASFYL